MTDRSRRIVYVLPVYNEAEAVGAFHAALIAATDTRPDLTFEFLYVDDGSRDDSLERLLDLRAKDERVSVVSLARNFGHQLAVTAGIDAAAAAGPDAVIVMDTDLQDPPAVSIEMIARWESGVDVVYAQRRSRQDTPFKRGTAAAFYWVLDKLAETPIPRDVGDFRLMDRRVVAEVVKYREHNRFLRGIVAQVGFRQEALLFDRDERFAGESKYPLRKMLRLAGDGIMGFSTQPLRLITHIGLLISALSVVGILYVLGVRVFDPDESVPGWAFLAVAMFFLGGVQLTMLGVIGSYVGRTYVEVLDRPLYSVGLAARGAGQGPDVERPVSQPDAACFAYRPDGSVPPDVGYEAPSMPAAARGPVRLMPEDGVDCPLWTDQDGLLFGGPEEFVEAGAPADLARDLADWAARRDRAGRTDESDLEALGLLDRLSAAFERRYTFVYKP